MERTQNLVPVLIIYYPILFSYRLVIRNIISLFFSKEKDEHTGEINYATGGHANTKVLASAELGGQG